MICVSEVQLGKLRLREKLSVAKKGMLKSSTPRPVLILYNVIDSCLLLNIRTS